MTQPGTTPGIKKIRAAGPMKELMGAYFKELDEASRTGSAKVAWCTSVGPVELLRSLGFLVYFPENHGALLGTSRAAAELIPACNAIGYSPDICSYLTSDVGSFLRGSTPLTRAFGMPGVPKPDVLVFNTNQCRDVQDWFSFYQRKFDVPLVGIDSPRNVGELSTALIQYVSAQLRALIPELERVAQQHFDQDRLRQVIDSSLRCTRLWKSVLRAATHAPSPITFFDGTIHMGPAVVLRGDERAIGYYELLLRELHDRIEHHVAAVDGEAHRLYWEGMPIWGKLREHAELLGSRQACVVASTYCNSWIFEALDDPDPFEGMARASAELFIARNEAFKEQYLERMVRDYGIDGIIYHDAKTCPNNSNNRYGLPERLAAKLGIPFVVLHADLNDLRIYSEEQARTQLEALAEQL